MDYTESDSDSQQPHGGAEQGVSDPGEHSSAHTSDAGQADDDGQNTHGTRGDRGVSKVTREDPPRVTSQNPHGTRGGRGASKETHEDPPREFASRSTERIDLTAPIIIVPPPTGTQMGYFASRSVSIEKKSKGLSPQNKKSDERSKASSRVAHEALILQHDWRACQVVACPVKEQNTGQSSLER